MGKVTFKMQDNITLDIGLNFIHKKDNLITPGLIRCNFGKTRMTLSNALYFIEISSEAVEIIRSYLEIFKEVRGIVKKGLSRYLDGERVFGTMQWQAQVKKIYIWILRNAHTGIKLVPINSKFAPKQDITFKEVKDFEVKEEKVQLSELVMN